MNTIESIIGNNFYQIAVPLTHKNSINLRLVCKTISNNFNDNYWKAKAIHKYDFDLEQVTGTIYMKRYIWLKFAIKINRYFLYLRSYKATSQQYSISIEYVDNTMFFKQSPLIDATGSTCKYEIELSSYFLRKKLQYEIGMDIFDADIQIGRNEYNLGLLIAINGQYDYISLNELYTKCSSHFVKNHLNKYGSLKIHDKNKIELPIQVQKEILELETHYMSDIDNYIQRLVQQRRFNDVKPILDGYYEWQYTTIDSLFPSIFDTINVQIGYESNEVLEFILVLYDFASKRFCESYLLEIVFMCDEQLIVMRYIMKNRPIYLRDLKSILEFNIEDISDEIKEYIEELIVNKNYTPDEEDNLC